MANAIQDSADLRVAVADHVGNRELGDVMPRLIRLAEMRIGSFLRSSERDKTTFSSLADSLPSTNWVLEEYPHVYLYAVSLEAAKHIKDAELVMALETLLGKAFEEMRLDDPDSRWHGQVVRLRGMTTP